MKPRIYKDKKREWRWSLIARNGKIVATSGEGYKRRKDCLHSLELVTHTILIQTMKNDLQLLVNTIASAQDGKTR